ncbi:hypothetical protein [Parapedomonas caeni]
MTQTEYDVETLASLVGQEILVSDWISISQEEINDFGRVTRDPGRVRQGGVISAVAVGHRQAALAVMCRG